MTMLHFNILKILVDLLYQGPFLLAIIGLSQDLYWLIEKNSNVERVSSWSVTVAQSRWADKNDLLPNLANLDKKIHRGIFRYFHDLFLRIKHCSYVKRIMKFLSKAFDQRGARFNLFARIVYRRP